MRSRISAINIFHCYINHDSRCNIDVPQDGGKASDKKFLRLT